MSRLANADIGIFFHVPNSQTIEFDQVADCIRCIFDVCSPSTVKYEQWDCHAENISVIEPKFFFTDDERSWEDKKSSFPSRVDFLVATLVALDKKERERKLIAYAALNYIRTETVPMIHGERTVMFMVPNALWKMMDREKLMKAIEDVRFYLGATYACIDILFFCPRSLYRTDFRYFREIKENLWVENIVPTVSWLQYLSPRMILSVGEAESIHKEFPMSRVAQNANDGSGIWIQLGKAPHLSHVKERMKFRDYFETAMYQLSLVKIAENRLPHMQLLIDRLPLREIEKDVIASLKNEQDYHE